MTQSNQAGTLVGHYEFIDDGRIKLQFAGWWGPGLPIVVGVALSGDILTMTFSNNAVLKMARQ
jgi:hypothetical protein